MSELPFVDFGEYAAVRASPEYPNWLNEQAYPRGADLTARQWGWEFLRRNPVYVYDWSFDQLKPGEFWLREALDPSLSPAEPKVFSFAGHTGSCFSPNEAIPSLSSTEVAIIFDLALPIDIQLRDAAKMLSRRRAGRRISGPHLRRDKYPVYLRLLDADWAGAKRSEIAHVLYPNLTIGAAKDSIKYARKAARELIWTGFRSLLTTRGGK